MVERATSDRSLRQLRSYEPRKSGNPAGKPVGVKNRATLVLDAIGTESCEEVLTTVVEAAIDGDLKACEIILDRVWQKPKGRLLPPDLDLPKLETEEDVPRFQAAIINCVTAGRITPDEAEKLSNVVENWRRSDRCGRLDSLLPPIINLIAVDP